MNDPVYNHIILSLKNIQVFPISPILSNILLGQQFLENSK